MCPYLPNLSARSLSEVMKLKPNTPRHRHRSGLYCEHKQTHTRAHIHQLTLQQKSQQIVLGLHHSTACKFEELTATIQPGLHHTVMRCFFWPVNPYFWSFPFFPHTHHTTYSGKHWLLVTTQENERKVRRSLRKKHTQTHTHTI